VFFRNLTLCAPGTGGSLHPWAECGLDGEASVRPKDPAVAQVMARMAALHPPPCTPGRRRGG
jgi:hypothetical protein